MTSVTPLSKQYYYYSFLVTAQDEAGTFLNMSPINQNIRTSLLVQSKIYPILFRPSYHPFKNTLYNALSGFSNCMNPTTNNYHFFSSTTTNCSPKQTKTSKEIQAEKKQKEEEERKKSDQRAILAGGLVSIFSTALAAYYLNEYKEHRHAKSVAKNLEKKFEKEFLEQQSFNLDGRTFYNNIPTDSPQNKLLSSCLEILNFQKEISSRKISKVQNYLIAAGLLTVGGVVTAIGGLESNPFLKTIGKVIILLNVVLLGTNTSYHWNDEKRDFSAYKIILQKSIEGINLLNACDSIGPHRSANIQYPPFNDSIQPSAPPCPTDADEQTSFTPPPPSYQSLYPFYEQKP